MGALFALEAGKSWLFTRSQTAEERLIRLVQAGQHVLQDVAVNRRVCRHLGAEVFQFGFLSVAQEGDATLPIHGAALLQGGVVERATAPQNRSQRPLLFGCWLELVVEGLAHRFWHRYTS